MRSSNAVNLLQELPKLKRGEGTLSYDLNGLALSYVRRKVDDLEDRLQAIEELLSTIYVRLDELAPVQTAATPDHEAPVPRRRRRPLIDSIDGTYVPSANALQHADDDDGGDERDDYRRAPWWKRLYIEIFRPERLRRNSS